MKIIRKTYNYIKKEIKHDLTSFHMRMYYLGWVLTFISVYVFQILFILIIPIKASLILFAVYFCAFLFRFIFNTIYVFESRLHPRPFFRYVLYLLISGLILSLISEFLLNWVSTISATLIAMILTGKYRFEFQKKYVYMAKK